MDVLTSLKTRVLYLLGEERSYAGPVADLEERKKQSATYAAEEVGLIHPVSRSVVKLRDNGAIDIFVPGHNGIRVDPTNGTVDIFGRVQHHASAIREWITKDSVTEVKEAWTVRSEGKVEVEAQTVLIKAAKNVRIESAAGVDVASVGDVTVHAKAGADAEGKSLEGNITLKADGNMELAAAKDVKIRAGGFIDLE